MIDSQQVFTTLILCVLFELFLINVGPLRSNSTHSHSKSHQKSNKWLYCLIIVLTAGAVKLGYDSLALPRNYYSIMEVGRHDNGFEIRRSYKTLSKIYHPDKNNAPNAVEVFQTVKDCFDVLTDENSRDLYNRFGPENLTFDPRKDELKVIVDLLSTYAFWIVVTMLATIQRGSKGCRVWIIFLGIAIMVGEITLKLTDTVIPDWFPVKTMTEFELIFYLHSLLPIFICCLRLFAESAYVDINETTKKVLLDVIQHQKNLSALLHQFETLLESTKTNVNESNQNMQITTIRENIVALRTEMEKNDLRYVGSVEELKKSSGSFGSNYYWLVFVLIYGGIYFLK